LSAADELANTITHGIGFLLSLVVGVYFWQLTQNSQMLGLRITCMIFSFTMATVYLFSTLSHWVQEPQRRVRMRAWDQGTIYLLIAGTYSPFIWQGSPKGTTWIILSMVWFAAALGFYSKVFSGYRLHGISTVTYVLLGWLPAIPLLARTPWVCFVWMTLGGVSYSLGILFLIRSERGQFIHAIWHIMVMLGSACHCLAIDILLHRTVV
jgi:hemolysin III